MSRFYSFTKYSVKIAVQLYARDLLLFGYASLTCSL